MYRPESRLPMAAAPDRQAAEADPSPQAPKVKSKYMNFAEALQTMIERADARRLERENSETGLTH